MAPSHMEVRKRLSVPWSAQLPIEGVRSIIFWTEMSPGGPVQRR
jgi:hypothetical protein